MKTPRFSLHLSLFMLLCGSVHAVDRADFSAEAQAFFPKFEYMDIFLEGNPKPFQGQVLKETGSAYTIRFIRGRQTSTKMVLKNKVSAIEKPDMSGQLAAALMNRFVLGTATLPDGEYEQAVKLFDEFIGKCPDYKHLALVQERRDEIAAESEKVQAGMRKVQDLWVNPVEESVWKFLYYGTQAKDMEKEHRGVDGTNFRGDPAIKATYDGFKDKRRASSRELPSMMRARQPLLLRENRFDQAASELTSFMHFILRMVLPATQGEREFRDFFGGKLWDQIDYKVVTDMQRTFFRTYSDAGGVVHANDRGVSHSEMVYVPGGYFLMGDATAKPGEASFPLHVVFVSPFLVDRLEVSNAEYRRFYDRVKSVGDSEFAHRLAPPMKDYKPDGWAHGHLKGDAQPVVGVDWYDAYAYTRFVGKRLLTEAEWERVARGTNFWKYAWGKETPGQRSVNCPEGRAALAADVDRQDPPQSPKSGWFSCKKEEPVPTRFANGTWEVSASLPKRAEQNQNFIFEPKVNSPFGVMHLNGNAAEWVSDPYAKDAYTRSRVFNPAGPEDDEGTGHVYRGGDYMSPATELTCHWRGAATIGNLRNGSRKKGQPTIGIRGARSLAIVENPIQESKVDLLLDAALKK